MRKLSSRPSAGVAQPMNLSTKNIIAQGSFADIFAYDDRVYKIYISRTHPRCNGRDRGEAENELRRIHFGSEFKAWEIASKNEELAAFIPRYYGRQDIEKVKNENGIDVSTNYLLDCCLSIAKVRARDKKFDKIRDNYPDVEAKFHQVGIMHTSDMSAFILDGGSTLKLIDFATEDAYYNTEISWLASGKI